MSKDKTPKEVGAMTPDQNREMTPKEVHNWINKNIISKYKIGDYIFRGESKEYTLPEGKPLSSGLYRQLYKDCTKIEEASLESLESFIKTTEDDERKEATKYASDASKREVLTELQHFGGQTALVDFTSNVLVALFFACDDNPNENGYLYLFPKKGKEKDLITPSNKFSRVISQSSVFIRAPKGYLDIVEENRVKIPIDKKQSILKYLFKFNGIDEKYIFNDMPGFIRNQKSRSILDRKLSKGIRFMEKEDYEAAIKEFNRVIKLCPDEIIELCPEYSRAYYNRGNAYSSLGNYDAAINDYDKVIELNPKFAFAYGNRGLANYRKGDYEEAIKDFNKTIKLNPKNALAYGHRGNAKYRKGDYEAAIKDFNKAIKLNPKNALAYNNRGLANYRKGGYEAAIKDYNKAIKLNKKYALAYNNRGNAKYRKGDYEAAIKDYNKAIKLNPEDALAYNNRGNAKGRKKDYVGAINDYDTAIKLNKKYALAYNNRGFAKYRKGNYVGAINDYDTAIELNPKRITAYNNRADAYDKIGKAKRAKKDRKKAKKLQKSKRKKSKNIL